MHALRLHFPYTLSVQVTERLSSSGLTAADCITNAEYRERIADHYANCGKTNTCVVFNFDVEGK